MICSSVCVYIKSKNHVIYQIQHKRFFLKYISIDGDDIGRKITSYYLSNNSNALSKLSLDLKSSTEDVSKKLSEYGFHIIFCAADGVVASTKSKLDFNTIFNEISSLSPKGVTFSAGVGDSLREAYIALTSAKSNGKNCLHEYANLDSINKEDRCV